MAQKRRGPGALAGATGADSTFKAGELNVNPHHRAYDGELHHALRIRRLHLQFGLTGPLAARIAALAFDGGAA